VEATKSKLLTTEELAKYLGVPIGTIYRWRTMGTGPPAMRVGRHLRFRKDEVDAWLETRRIPPPEWHD